MSKRKKSGDRAETRSNATWSDGPSVSTIASWLRREQEAGLENLQEENKVLRDQVTDDDSPPGNAQGPSCESTSATRQPRAGTDKS